MTIKELLAIKKPTSRDFLALRVGGMDEFSVLGYAALKRRMTPEDIAKVEKGLEIHAERSKVYRWILRGLPVDYAIRKVDADSDVAANSQYARGEDDWWDDEDETHPPKQPEEFNVGEFTLIRPHTNKVLITKAGEILAEKEINCDHHFNNFLNKFTHNQAYRDSLTGGA